MLRETFGGFVGRRTKILETRRSAAGLWTKIDVSKSPEFFFRGKEFRGLSAYRKDQGNPTPHRFGAVQVGLGADEQILLALCRLPGENGGAEEKDLDGLAGGQARRDFGVVF